ncbi:hypothetical protein GCM10009839_89040 [Catenulispora yoronensis]|uniref:Protein kinase domain-containing protein n=1 Tax=Catenulispora yoronensis TaxID=450799 RepID=A0ABP5H3F2_9ACTN
MFRARRVADGHEVAVKRIAAAAPRELEIAEKVMSLGQPEQLLVPFASASDGPDLLLFMPLALEGSLADEIAARPGGWDESEVLAIVHDIVAGLIELNAAGIVHRDLKPANILLYQGRWHLADFGMSRDLDVRTATLTYTMGGTPLYYAPERLLLQPATHKGDLYALGLIAYELAAGRPPFNGATIDELRRHQLSTPPPVPPVGPVLGRWILRLLDKDPARRHQDAAAAQASLPAADAPAGQLAAVALQRQQRLQAQTARDGQASAEADARVALRTQALADLEDICAGAADLARLQLPDLKHSSHGATQQFDLDDLRLSITVWSSPDAGQDLAAVVLAGEARSARTLANVVCENEAGALRWYLDSVTKHPLTGIVGAPQGLARAEFFQHYPYLRDNVTHVWVRRRAVLDPQAIVDLLVDLLREDA